MDSRQKLELIGELIQELGDLSFNDEAALDAVRRRAEMFIRNIHGESSRYLTDLANIRFHTMWAPSSPSADLSAWESGTDEMMNLLNTMRDEVVLFGSPSKAEPSEEPQDPGSADKKVFIVHGSDEATKQSVARSLENLGLEAVILHEKPNVGRTLIEKFTDYSDASFAVVLLTPDDVAYQRSATSENAKFRARQNVIFELGYFIGRLGRGRVVALHTQDDDFEMPSDYSGVLFVPFDSSGRWQLDLVKELKACGFDVDANRLIE